jgi:DNA-binding winged helix-turn-helix (wHTH) protein
MKRALPFHELASRIISDLATDHCVAVTGLSNSGKSTLMRALAGENASRLFQKESGRVGVLIYVDCNRAVALTAQAFYEVVLRTITERLTGDLPDHLANILREHHQSITEAETSFTASLSFNLALRELCEQLERDIILLLDEVDEIYVSLDQRALLNLRALHDRFRSRLSYVTATLRSLPELRGQTIEDEFAEMFSRFTYPMPLLAEDDGKALLQEMKLSGLTEARVVLATELSGGHPGLLIAVGLALAGLPQGWDGDPEAYVKREPQPRAECLKIWSQLSEEERESVTTLVVNPEEGLPNQQMRRLEGLGLVRSGQIFSAVFSAFVARKAHGAEIGERGVHLDADSGDVWVDGVRIPVLTDLEFRLMRLLHEREDKITDKYKIVTEVWGEDYLGDVDDARVEKLISRLRSKIEPDPTNPRYLITHRGRGYKLISTPRNS